ncbi:MAG TPA: TRAP transporter substrate-binding protein [Burkholderiales bacterium]|nr:TRAP transporter substrate-binding protein [Burkholderiales bacterium]
MKHKSVWRGIVTAALLVAAVQAWAQANALRFNWWIPPNHLTRTKIMDVWVKQVEAATQGRVKIEFTATSLGAPPRQFDLVRDGVADLAMGVHGYTPDRFVLPQVAELPFMSDSAEALSVALWRTHAKFFAARNEYEGVKLIGVMTHGPGSLWSPKAPIRSLADLKGLKVRAGGGLQNEIVAKLGAAVVSAPAPQTFEILSRGVADATLFTNDAVASFGLGKLLKFNTRVPGGLFNSTFFVVMNEAKWNALAPQDRAAIEALSGEAFARLGGKGWDDTDREVAATLAESQVVQPDAKFMAELRDTLKGLDAQWVADAKSKRGVDGAAAMEFLRAQVAGYKP